MDLGTSKTARRGKALSMGMDMGSSSWRYCKTEPPNPCMDPENWKPGEKPVVRRDKSGIEKECGINRLNRRDLEFFEMDPEQFAIYRHESTRLRSKRCFGWRAFVPASCSAGGGQGGWGR